MKSAPPVDLPWQDRPDDLASVARPVRAGRGCVGPALADVETLRLPAVRPASATALADLDTQPLPGVPASGRHAGAGAASSRPAARQARSARAARPADRLRPWLLRLALVAGLIALVVRAGLDSSVFMAPGGSILGWSQAPQARCVLCHVPQPTAAPQSHPLTPAEYAALLVPRLSLDDELGQLMLVQFVGTSATPDTVQMLNSQGAGGVLFFSANIRSPAQLRALNAQLQQLSAIPPLLAIDQEGGPVNRFYTIVGPLPSASSLAMPQAAQARGMQDSGYLHDYGFNLDLAPVVDVGTANPQLAGRTFGSTPARVELMAGAYLAGLQQSGFISGALKHFPGLGSTTVDPHIGLPVLMRSRAQWEQIDLDPYRVLLKTQDVRMIMVTHELVPAVDSTYPASLSPALIDGVLRGELGYDGVVVTDSLYMGALNRRWSVPEAAVLAIKAGADLVIGPYNPEVAQQTKDALKQAISNGTLTKARIDTSVERILTLKIRMGLIPLPKQQTSDVPALPAGLTTGAAPEARLPE